MNELYDVIIVGAGPSGIYAGYLAQLHNLKVLIVEASNDPGGQMKLFLDKPIYDLPGHINVNGREMLKLLKQQFHIENDNKIILDEEVIDVDGSINNFTVKTNKSLYLTRSVIISTGGGTFKPIPLGIKNEEKYNNISYSISNAKKYTNKKLIIFGGGDSAVDWAHYFFKKNTDVTLIHRRDIFRGQEHLVEEMKNKINIMTPYKLIEVSGEKNIEKVKLMNIRDKNINELNCDHVLVFFGQKKIINKEKNPFKLQSDKEGYLVNSNMETKRKGIFAIGNVSKYKGKVNIMITGLGEAATAIGSIVELVYPEKKMSYFVKKKEN